MAPAEEEEEEEEEPADADDTSGPLDTVLVAAAVPGVTIIDDVPTVAIARVDCCCCER
jgi:hypothetical protein